MIIVMGLPGAGKSTVLSGVECEKVNWGDLMFELAKKKHGIEHRDGIRKLPPTAQSEIQEQVANELAKRKGQFILDTHCSVRTEKGYLPGIPYRLLSKLKVDYLVLVTAPIEQIMSRRKKDMAGSAGRVRELDEREAREHDAHNRALLAAYSVLSGAPAMIVLNEDNGLARAQERIQILLA
jgi:adenylate kinase